MRKIVYIDGYLADQLGHIELKCLAAHIAEKVKAPIDLLTHGHSEHHSNRRIIGLLDQDNAK